MNGMNSESVDLIYIDPPFNSKRTYSAPVGSKAAGAAFKDMWTWSDVDVACLERLYAEYPYLAGYIDCVGNIHSKAMASYVTYMAQRIIEMHRILKPTGSFYLHVDPTASHYLKVVCDRIFGKSNFQNEIVWHYTGGGRAHKYFSRKHDVIFLYTKTLKWLFNIDAVRVPYKKTSGYAKSGITSKSGKKYMPNPLGTPVDDVWDIPIINPLSRERTGYPTQKPLELMYRIIKASSNEGDVVFDPFCGCATTLVAAEKSNREWIGIDIEKKSVELVQDRLKDAGGLFSDFVHTSIVPVRNDVKPIVLDKPAVKKSMFAEQDGICTGCGTGFEIRNFHIDHILPRVKRRAG